MMLHEPGSGCRYLDDDGDGTTTCRIQAGIDEPTPEAQEYWERNCRDYPRYKGEDAPQNDADWLILQKLLEDFGCGCRVVKSDG
jgi:hypothetical protein